MGPDLALTHSNFERCEQIGGLEISQMSVNFEGHTPKHSHKSAYFSFILEGAYTMDCRGKGRLCEASSLVYYPKNTNHAVYRHTPLKTLNVNLGVEFADTFNIEGFISRDNLIQKGKGLNRLAGQLHNEFSLIDEYSPLIVENLTSLLAAEFFRSSDKLTTTDAPNWLMRARDIVADQFIEKLTTREIAKYVGVHPIHLTQEFRRCFNITIGEYARKRRVEFSCERLKRSKMPLSEIAVESGFYDQSHFTRVFKKATGITPAAYRKFFQAP